MSQETSSAQPPRPVAGVGNDRPAVDGEAERSTRRPSLQDAHSSQSSDVLHPAVPAAQRDIRKTLSSSTTPAGGALAMLARSSLGMGLGDANSSSTSLDQAGGVRPSESGHSFNDENAKPGESSNIIIGPNGILIPRSSILLNPSKRKSLVDSWRTFDEVDGSPRAPAVLQIPVVPSAKDREAERERQKLEREQEIEREWREKEQAEKVWGIPKKAFYMGLGEINFNAQMAMLAGWGNGSGGLYDFRPTPMTAMHRLRKQSPSQSRARHGKSSSSSGKRRRSPSTSKDSHSRTASAKSQKKSDASSTKTESSENKQNNTRPLHEPRYGSDSSDSDESMDLGELAALNAIINTRRSMEAAQLLAKGETRPLAKKRSVSSVKRIDGEQKEAIAGADARESICEGSFQSDATPEVPSSQVSLQTKSSKRPPLTQSVSDQPAVEPPRIRFAPLPFNYLPPAPSSPLTQRSALAIEAPSDASNGPTPGSASSHDGILSDFGRRSEDGSYTSGDRSDDKSIISERSDADSDDDGEETWTRRGVSLKPKWYLMGMPKGVFLNPSKRQRRALTGSAMNAAASELSTSPGTEKRLSGQFSDGERQSRRRGRARTTSSRASSVKSRSSSVGSIDEEERMRRRQLIRATRPGGTGMVTLPDGSRIRARRVGEEDSDEELQQHWGFARLVREAQRQQKDIDEDEQKATGADETANGSMEVDETIDSVMDRPDGKISQEPDATLPTHESQATQSEQAASDGFERAAAEADGVSSAKRRRQQRQRTASMMATSSSTDEAYTRRREGIAASHDRSNANRSQESLHRTSTDNLRASPTMLEMDEYISEQHPTATSSAIRSADSVRGPKRSTTLPTAPITLSAEQAAEVRRRHEQEVLALGNEVLENMAKAKRARQHAEQSERNKAKEQSEASRNTLTLQTSPSDLGQQRQGPMSPQQASSDGRQERGRERRLAIRSATQDDQKPVLDPRRQLFSSLVRGSSVRRTAGISESGAIFEDDERPSAPQTGTSTPLARRNGRPSTPLNDRLVVRSVDASPSPAASRRHSLATTHDAKQMSELSNSIATLRKMNRLDDGFGNSALMGSPLDFDDSMSTETAQANGQSHQLQDESMVDSQDSKVDSVLQRNGTTIMERSRSGRRFRTLIPPQELPRRPDQRGYAVVPLPHDQLGRRPSRPVQGRFWESDPQDEDEEDQSDDDEGNDRTIALQNRRGSHSGSHAAFRSNGRSRFSVSAYDDDTSDSELDAEELAEEERRTAQQKKRATTRAAGAEVVRGTTSHRKITSSPMGRSMSRVRERRTNGSTSQISSPSGRLMSPQRRANGSAFDQHGDTATTKGSSSTAIDEVSARLQALPLDSRGRADDREKMSGTPRIDIVNASQDTPLHRLDAEEVFAADTESDDDAELWPPTLANALGTTPATSGPIADLSRTRSSDSRYTDGTLSMPRRGSQSSSYAMSTSPGSIKSPLQERPSLRLRAVSSFDMAAHAAKSRAARIKRSARQRAAAAMAATDKNGHADAQHPHNDFADESLDYGWPKSLQGSSLY